MNQKKKYFPKIDYVLCIIQIPLNKLREKKNKKTKNCWSKRTHRHKDTHDVKFNEQKMKKEKTDCTVLYENRV